MDDYISLLSALVALLVGLAIGKAWERYKLKDGRWIDRRRARESPHYMLGLNFLVGNQGLDDLDGQDSVDTVSGGQGFDTITGLAEDVHDESIEAFFDPSKPEFAWINLT